MQGEISIVGPAACPNGFVATHSDTLTASDGSRVSMTISETSCPRPADPSTYDCTGTYAITGGTGRFTSATGGGRWAGSVAFAPDGSATFTTSYSGTLPTPVEVRSAREGGSHPPSREAVGKASRQPGSLRRPKGEAITFLRISNAAAFLTPILETGELMEMATTRSPRLKPNAKPQSPTARVSASLPERASRCREVLDHLIGRARRSRRGWQGRNRPVSAAIRPSTNVVTFKEGTSNGRRSGRCRATRRRLCLAVAPN